MNAQQRSKKSETLEVRLSLEAKAAFMARCRDQGRTASAAVRAFVEQELSPAAPAPRARSRPWRVAIAAAAAGLAVGAVAAPSLAHPARDARSAFDRLDRNHDGVLSFDEFRRD